MEILYYWIDRYDKIMRQGFNFGGELLFEYDESKKKLIINENYDYIKDFFHYKDDSNINCINNISAIVGRNGSGKTTFLNALKGLIVDGGIILRCDEEDTTDFLQRIFIYESDRKIHIIFHKDLISKNEEGNYNVEFNCSKEFDIQFIGYSKNENVELYKNKYKRVIGTEILGNTACIYFSNLFDSNFFYYTTMRDRQYFDISTRGILHQTDKWYDEQSNTINIQNSNHINHKDERFGVGTLKDYYLNELKLKFKFLRDRELGQKIPFSIPESLSLNLDYMMYRNEHFDFFDINEQNFLRYEKDINNLNKIERYTYEYIRKNAVKSPFDNQTISDKDLAKRTFLLRIADAFFDDIDRFIFFNKNKELIRDMIDQIDDSQLCRQNIYELFDIYKNSIISTLGEKGKNEVNDNREFNVSNFMRLVDSYIDFVKYIDNFFDNQEIEFDRGNVFAWRKNGATSSVISEDICLPEIKLDDNGIELANQFLDKYSNIFTASDFIRFVWRNISTGEDALLSMYSRFYNVKNEISYDNLIIISDEGEGYFHPEWQRRYIHALIEYLPVVFSKCKSIQVIASSNSPFLIADLPKNNVMFLEQYDKEEQQLDLSGRCKVVNGFDFKQTFAANIHGLLIDNFFLSSTIGEFADKKIKEVIKAIKSLEEEDIPQYKIEDIRRTIDLIGEPIIRKRLQGLFVKRFRHDDIRFEEDKKKQLLQEIERLKKINDKSELDDIDNIIEILKDKVQQLKKKADNND
jgi:energy-coupling factor transporter ATP-binding protein EcfA2